MHELFNSAKALLPELTACRRELHAHPELGLNEVQTAAFIEAKLDEWHIPHHRVGKTNVVGVLKGEHPGNHTIALRADIDALPIQELNDVPYRSQTDGVMHACGHDAHTACLLGAAQLLSQRRAEFGGEVRFLFQSAEEIGKGQWT